jgi:hypothetical protein
MNDPDQGPNLSPLTRSISHDGKTVRVDIYEDGTGKWILEPGEKRPNPSIEGTSQRPLRTPPAAAHVKR